MSSEKLTVGDFGDEVSRLHENLKKQGFEVSEEEVKRKFFGPSTRDAVRKLQKAHGLEVSGEVNKETAAQLSISEKYNLAEDSAKLKLSGVIHEAEPLETVDLINPGINIKFNYMVEGKVSSLVSAGVGGLRVVVVDKGIGGDLELAQAVTDNSGSYQVTFSDNALLSRGKTKPDLQARVFISDTFLGSSEVRYNASLRETLNVLLEDKVASALRSEHEVLTSVLASQFKGKLGDLKENDVQQDITYLANKTGWDARTVALAALADQFSANAYDKSGAKIDPTFFYALFRAGLPANEDVLYHTDAKTLEGVWKTAVEQGVIHKTSVNQIPNLIAQFQALSAQKLITSPALVGVSSISEMLTLSGLIENADMKQKTEFATKYAANRNDMSNFWKEIDKAFPNVANKLKVNSKLGFLTINNAPLMNKVHTEVGDNGLTDLLELAQKGYHRAKEWKKLLNDVPIPNEIPGDNLELKQDNYAEYLAAQVRLSYPTASVAQMVKSGEIKLEKAKKPGEEKPGEELEKYNEKVNEFLTKHQGKFEIGVQSVDQYIAHNNLHIEDYEIVRQVKRLERVYQITPNDQALVGLMDRGIDSAYHVVRYDKDTFVQSFSGDLGGADHAVMTYDKSVQVHNTVLNVVLNYLTARTAPAIGVHSPPSVLNPAPANAGDVIAYARLESLFGSMDFCECEHCRSILSPAAYLVDLLLFLQSDPDVWASYVKKWKEDHTNIPYPFTENTWQEFQNSWKIQHPGQPLPNTEISPFDVLMSRRPDIQYLPLTCENTNTALPYIDVVNETLEYFIANDSELLSLKDYCGHDTNGVASEDLLASPQFVSDSAYKILENENFPAPLPFHQPLENIRRYFGKFDISLPLAMERLRKSDAFDVDRAATPPPPLTDYGWCDILMEEVGLSRAEYKILTDSKTVPLWKMYGFPKDKDDREVIAGLSNAKQFARRMGITYEDLISILMTRFINPNSDLIPKLERLGVNFAMLDELHRNKNDALTDAKFDALIEKLAVQPDPAEYDDNIKAWVKNDANYDRIMKLITLVIQADTWTAPKDYSIGDCVWPTSIQSENMFYYECTTLGTSDGEEPDWPKTPGETCKNGTVVWICRDASSCHSFGNLAFRYSDPAKMTQNIGAVEFVRLLRFIRLWKKLGWTIEQTDAAICSLYREDLAPLDERDIDDITKLNTGFLTLLPRLGIAIRVMKALDLTVKGDLLQLLAFWSDIGTHGNSALYRQMFLNPAVLEQDEVFADNGYGEFLQDASQTLLASKSEVKVRLAGKITTNDILTTSINGVEIPYKVVTEDTTVAILATHIVSTINATTVADPNSGLPLNQVVLASNSMGTITIKSLNPDVSIKLACSLSTGATEIFAILDHEAALRAAFNLTGEEYGLIAEALGYKNDTALTVHNISAIFRWGWLARKLKISVLELLLLKKLTGLDPFKAPVPTNPDILCLIEMVQAMKDRSFKSSAALYLIWNQDLSGKSAPDAAQVAAFARTLRLGFAAIETEFAIADDPSGAITQTRMAEVYGADTASFFSGILNDTLNTEVEFSDNNGIFTKDIVRQPIEAAAGKTDAGVTRITYDDFHKRLSYSGVLTNTKQVDIATAAGTEEAAFKTAVAELYKRNQAVVNPFFTRYPELRDLYNAYVSDTDTTHSVTEKRTKLLKDILPELVQRRKRQQALQSVSAMVNNNLAFTQTFLDPSVKPFPLHAIGYTDQPALNDFLALEKQGLSVQFYASYTATGDVIPSPNNIASNLDYAPLVGGVGNPLPDNPTLGNAISGIWCGYLEAPESGSFKLLIEADASAKVELLLDGKSVLTQNGTIWNNEKSIELRGGTLYPLRLTIENVIKKVCIQWDWQPRGQGLVVIPSRYLYPEKLFDKFQEAYIRYMKTASLAIGLGLTANEIAYYATHEDYLINSQGEIDKNGQSWLNFLPKADNLHIINPHEADFAKKLNATLLIPLLALLNFARIKAEISPSDESLLTILKDPMNATQKKDSLLYNLTRWDSTSLNELLIRFGKVKDNDGKADFKVLSSPDIFARIYDAFELVRKMGISAKALIQATTNEPTSVTVRDLQAALRARYAAVDWRDVIRPINDEMRSLQRDALVAYILHQMRSNPYSAHIDTPGKLFEYFLMDVQMDPCMQTSRIRHALSSLQLFIERCLMNLEPRVSPAAINAKQWEWMKRYRVWEANRKVYLFPENWLEPELRDDKSPFFKEIESELLQSDITEDLAATALLNYLSKLSDVAQLEPCGIYHIPADPTKRTGEINHVVARTSGGNRKYYYRRKEYGYWTPWEPINLDIEDNPVIPVVWKDRLLLFWLRILKDAPLDPNALSTSNVPKNENGTEKNLTQIGLSDIVTSAKNIGTSTQINVKAVLCWSEYYNGKWQATRTSDVNNPISLGTSHIYFDRSTLRLWSDESSEDQLRIFILGYQPAFVLYNTHSLPVTKNSESNTHVGKTRLVRITPGYFRNDYIRIMYFEWGVGQTPFRNVHHIDLTDSSNMAVIEPNHQTADAWDAPFLLGDRQNVFYVTGGQLLVLVSDYVGIFPNLGDIMEPRISPLVIQPSPQSQLKPRGDGVLIGLNTGFIDLTSFKQFVTEDAYINQVIGTTTVVMYGDRQIGPSGVIRNFQTGRRKL